MRGYWRFVSSLMVMCFALVRPAELFADDTCIFEVPPGGKPLIALFFDNSVEMEQVEWHTNYPGDNEDYAGKPNPDVEKEVLDNLFAEDGGIIKSTGNIFTNERGYAVTDDGILVAINNETWVPNATGWTSTDCDAVTGRCAWTIRLSEDPLDEKKIYLPKYNPNDNIIEYASTSGAQTAVSEIDQLRLSKDYLNWLFFSAAYGGNGTDLPDASRFFYMKQAVVEAIKQTANNAKFGLYYFMGDSNARQGGSEQFLVKTINAEASDNVLAQDVDSFLDNMKINIASPLAEGLAYVGYQIAKASTAPSVGDCAELFIIVISPGVSSYDLNTKEIKTLTPINDIDDFDGDGDTVLTRTAQGNIITYTPGTIFEETIPVNTDGSTYLDDIAYELWRDETYNIKTYTLGVLPSPISNNFLINTSNNGNGYKNLYETEDEDYGAYHFNTDNPAELSEQLLEAINSILGRANVFVAPVVPVTRTYSGNTIYLSFFIPKLVGHWEGNMEKFGLNEDNQIIDKSGVLATGDNDILLAEAVPYWATEDWANSIDYSARNIYTYLGTPDLTVDSNNFVATNGGLSDLLLGNPASSVANVVNYVRGQDILDEDKDGVYEENRSSITGDILHSEATVFDYTSLRRLIFFGANDGMLHAVNDSIEGQLMDGDNPVEPIDGSEAWAFVPPSQLPRLKELLESESTHSYFVDGSPEIYHNDENGDGLVNNEEELVLASGLRKGGQSYFALNVADPDVPKFMWEISSTSENYSMLGESWSEPVFAKVKTTDDDEVGTLVMAVGAGYPAGDAATGEAVLLVDVLGNGSRLEVFTDDRMSAVPSQVVPVNVDSDNFINKLYVGDLGGQLWRIGKFTDVDSVYLTFPATDENAHNWTPELLFSVGAGQAFYYPPTVVLERGFDMILGGTGDRENPCFEDRDIRDIVFGVKDNHRVVDRSIDHLDWVNGDSVDAYPADDYGWYYELGIEEKLLSSGTVFAGGYYFTTFTSLDPEDYPCVTGGVARLYALDYMTGQPFIDWDGDGNKDFYVEIGYGIPSKPVIIVTEDGPRLFVAVGTPKSDDAEAPNIGAEMPAIVQFDLESDKNFFYLWWKELTD